MWEPAKYGNLKSVAIPSSSIWVPDVILFNSADGKYEITLMTRANISFDGKVIWEPPAIFKSSCTINVEFFPFDVQLCTMKVIKKIFILFQSILYNIFKKSSDLGHMTVGK